VNPFDPELFFDGSFIFLITALISLLVIDLFRFLYCLGSIFVGHMYLEIYPFILDIPVS
jgi:hypothetical protein